MTLVIEIPDGYDVASIQNGSIASKVVLNAVKNGTPLPKGHGKLFDERDIEFEFRPYVSWSDLEYVKGRLKTIIEADNVGREE